MSASDRNKRSVRGRGRRKKKKRKIKRTRIAGI